MSKSTLPSARLSRADAARLRAQTVMTATCHLWMGAVGRDGYGKFWVPTPDGPRVITPHAAVSQLASGPLPLGSTHLHDCDVRICLRVEPGHLHRGTQGENVRQAVARGRLRGSRPGLADARGPAGASHAVQDAIRAAIQAGEMSPAGLAQVLIDTLAAGFPMVDVVRCSPNRLTPWPPRRTTSPLTCSPCRRRCR